MLIPDHRSIPPEASDARFFHHYASNCCADRGPMTSDLIEMPGRSLSPPRSPQKRQIVSDGAHPEPSSSAWSPAYEPVLPAAQVHEMWAACGGSLATWAHIVAAVAASTAVGNELPLYLCGLSGCSANRDDAHRRVRLAVVLIPASPRVLGYTPVVRTSDTA